MMYFAQPTGKQCKLIDHQYTNLSLFLIAVNLHAHLIEEACKSLTGTIIFA